MMAKIYRSDGKGNYTKVETPINSFIFDFPDEPDQYLDLTSGCISFKCRFSGLPRCPKSKKKRVVKKYLKKWNKFWSVSE